MVYIRAKKVKDDQYLYLVKSVWDSSKNTSKQEIVKYLGKSTDVTKEDLPNEFRNDPKILSFLAAHSPEDLKKREESSKNTKKIIYKRLTEGDIHGAIEAYDEYIKLFETEDFFDRILKPVMTQIGDEWENGKLDIATEHVASNIAQILVRIILDRISVNVTKKKVLICVPMGEEHHLGCDVIESYLMSKGYKVFNMSTSIPSESIVKYSLENKPDVILISITLKDNIKAGQRLVNKIMEQTNIPIFVGGFALEDNDSKFNAQVVRNLELNQLPRLIKNA